MRLSNSQKYWLILGSIELCKNIATNDKDIKDMLSRYFAYYLDILGEVSKDSRRSILTY